MKGLWGVHDIKEPLSYGEKKNTNKETKKAKLKVRKVTRFAQNQAWLGINFQTQTGLQRSHFVVPALKIKSLISWPFVIIPKGLIFSDRAIYSLLTTTVPIEKHTPPWIDNSPLWVHLFSPYVSTPEWQADRGRRRRAALFTGQILHKRQGWHHVIINPQDRELQSSAEFLWSCFSFHYVARATQERANVPWCMFVTEPLFPGSLGEFCPPRS